MGSAGGPDGFVLDIYRPSSLARLWKLEREIAGFPQLVGEPHAKSGGSQLCTVNNIANVRCQLSAIWSFLQI